MRAFQNQWGAAGSNHDPQRRDMFRVTLNLPQGLAGNWENDIQFALENWPFPRRTSSTHPLKYLNQTNHILGADNATDAITVNVRYAFNQATVKVLEAWRALTSNPRTGGVMPTSRIKTDGIFSWLVPNVSALTEVNSNRGVDIMKDGGQYKLEGVMLVDFSPPEASHTVTEAVATYSAQFSIDRYYPMDINAMITPLT